ncbi:MAG: UDP-N-acetylmuramoyl-tripeptide--D-alanyl-D-alanine ligase [Flavobacteriales bacterium]|nr:UDP-N-acetylmuramoyl-tripeptide--D-alanyl-D-alanine ligase [Flavobacteriales bacterium]
MDINEIYQLFKKHPLISTDTRSIKKNSLFFALKGENFNGNKFAEEAIKLGAAYSIIDEKEFSQSDKLILVDDVLAALQQLATHHRKQLDIPIIGITGTNGKTTTKELTQSVLSQQHVCYATKGNLNNHIGVPLSVLEINNTHEIAIIEMGANHIGEIADLCEISQPTIGLITNIGKAHLEGFGSFEGVKKAKSELYNYLGTHDSPIFINSDNQILTELGDGLFQVTYGENEKNQIIGQLQTKKEHLVLSWKKHNYLGFTPPISTNLVGNYNFENVLAAICIGNHFELTPEQITRGIESYRPSNNRSQLVKKKTNEIILDAYNANPVSLKAAIENIINSCRSQKLLIVGDMKELGKYSSEEHQAIVNLILENSLNAYLIGPEFGKTNHDKLTIFSTTEDVEKHLENNPIENTLILIKGSRSIGLEKLVEII